MPLGTDLGLDPGHYIVSEADKGPHKRGTAEFGPCLLWPHGRQSQQLLRSGSNSLVDMEQFAS